MLNTKTV